MPPSGPTASLAAGLLASDLKGATAEAGSSGGVRTVLSSGETAKSWLNRNIKEYMGMLRRERRFTIFRDPVPTTVPFYHDVIKQPMDFSAIRDLAAKGGYASAETFTSDLKLVVDNARAFNPGGHPVNSAAAELWDVLNQRHGFFTKVHALWESVQQDEAARLEGKRRKDELAEARESLLAGQVQAGMTVAVLAADDGHGNGYYLLRTTGPTRRLARDSADGFGVEHPAGSRVVEGHYYDYWPAGSQGGVGAWDRTARLYYLQESMRAMVPASSLLLVDCVLSQRQAGDDSGRTLWSVGADLHEQIRSAARTLEEVDDD